MLESQTTRDMAEAIVAMERDALERGARGDATAFVEISDPDVAYFDPFLEQRLDGRDALRDYYHKLFKPIEEEVEIELLNPRVQLAGESAVLTFNYRDRGRTSGRVHLWNCTEVYRQTPQGWRIIQTHWSWTKPQLAGTE